MLQVWNLETGQSIATLLGHTFEVTCCTVFNNVQKALSGSGNSTLRVWNFETGQFIATLTGQIGCVRCCTVVDNDQTTLSGRWGQDAASLESRDGRVDCHIDGPYWYCNLLHGL